MTHFYIFFPQVILWFIVVSLDTHSLGRRSSCVRSTPIYCLRPHRQPAKVNQHSACIRIISAWNHVWKCNILSINVCFVRWRTWMDLFQVRLLNTFEKRKRSPKIIITGSMRSPLWMFVCVCSWEEEIQTPKWSLCWYCTTQLIQDKETLSTEVILGIIFLAIYLSSIPFVREILQHLNK